MRTITALTITAIALAPTTILAHAAAAQGPPPPRPELPGRGPDARLERGPGRPRGPGGPDRAPGLATQDDALREVQHAYDRLRNVGLLSQTGGGDTPSSPLMSEGRTAYEAALSRYQSGNYTSARELAAAAGDMAAASDALLNSRVRSAGSGALALTAPPVAATRTEDTYRVRMDALRASEHAARMDSLARTLPQESQARRVAGIGVSLAQRAERTASDGNSREAGDLARAAEATSRAAQHLYADHYVSRGSALPAAAGPPASPPPPPIE